jgi:shikimate kinase
MNLVLIGFPRAGKTTLAAKLASKLEVPFIDSDDLCMARHSPMTCSEIFKFFGEAYFRKLETKAIKELERYDGTVIATGGGTLLNPQNLNRLKSRSLFIYLDTKKAVLKKRLLSPPLPSYISLENPEASFEKLYQNRLPIYQQIADIKWSCDFSPLCFFSNNLVPCN